MSEDKSKNKDAEVAEDDDEPLIVTLEYDDGVVVETEVMGIFDVDGKEYIALIPHDDSDDVYIYGYKEAEDETFDLIDIEDDAEFEKAVAAFDKLVAGEE